MLLQIVLYCQLVGKHTHLVLNTDTTLTLIVLTTKCYITVKFQLPIENVTMVSRIKYPTHLPNTLAVLVLHGSSWFNKLVSSGYSSSNIFPAFQ